ncbi:MAG: helix-turn-helix transcriptional regulator, partial [Burkholderia gladioli]
GSEPTDRPKRARIDTQLDICDTMGNPVDVTEFVFVPRYNVKTAAGHGSTLADGKPPLPMAFRRYWIDHYLRVNPTDLAVIAVKGDSMEGVLSDRDVILVNQADCRPGNGLYVLRMDGELFVKRLQRLPEGALEVSSANEVYRPFTINLSSPPSDFDIIGRVVWVGHQV